MKKEINDLWIGFVLICILTIILSNLNCVKFVPKYFEGLPFDENDVTYGFDGKPLKLPEPTYYNAFGIVVGCSTLCIILTFFKKRFLNIAGNAVALFQMLSVCFLPSIRDYLEEIGRPYGCAIGAVHGRYEAMPMCFIVGGLCIVVFAYSILITITYTRYKNSKL